MSSVLHTLTYMNTYKHIHTRKKNKLLKMNVSVNAHRLPPEHGYMHKPFYIGTISVYDSFKTLCILENSLISFR